MVDISMLKRKFYIESLETRRSRSLLRLMYDQSKAVDNLQDVKNNVVLRSSTKVKMKVDFTRLTKIQRSPLYTGLKLWDQLPNDVQQESNKSKFKEKVRKCIS